MALPQIQAPRSRQPEYLRTAKTLLVRGRADEAIKLLCRALEISPEDVEATLLLAKAQITSRKYTDARNILSTLLERGEDAQAYQLLIRLELGLKDIASAVEIASTAVTAFPQDDRLIALYRKAQQLLEPEEDPTDIDGPPPDLQDDRLEPEEVETKETVVQVDLIDFDQVPTRKLTREEIAEALIAPDDPTPPMPERAVELKPDDPTPPPVPERAVEPEDQPTRNLRRPAEGTLDEETLDDEEPPAPRFGPLWGEGAPDLVGAVERFLAAANPQKPADFSRLLGDGPEISHPQQSTPEASAAAEKPIEKRQTPLTWDDEDLFELDDDDFEEILSSITESTPAEILTPPICPKARLRLVPSSDYDCASLDEPTPSTPRIDLSEIKEDNTDERTTAPYPSAARRKSGGFREEPTAEAEIVQAVSSAGVKAPSPLLDRFSPEKITPSAALQALRVVSTPSVPSPASLPTPATPSPLPVHAVPPPPPPEPSVPSVVISSVPSIPSMPPPLPPARSLPAAPDALVPSPSPSHDIPTRAAKARPAAQTTITLRRGSRFWLTATCLGMLTISLIVLGFMLARQFQAQRHLETARSLALTYQAQQLKKALYSVKEAATLGGRTAEVLALAAAVHARLTVEFGESDIDATATMIEQSNRLGAPFETAAAQDIAIANGYFMLATKPLPTVSEYLRKMTEQHSSSVTLARLYAETLIRRGELQLAARVLHQLPADDGGVLRALADLHWQQGRRQTARSYLQAAALSGLTADQVALFTARLQLRSGEVNASEIITMRRLGDDEDLSRVERGWARIIEASLLLRRDTTSARQVLQQGLKLRPIAEGDFYYHSAQLLRRLGDREKAMQQIETARRADPGNLYYRTLEAKLQLEMDRPGFAIAQLSALPRDVGDAKVVLGHAFLRQGELSMAREAVASLPSQAADRRTVESRILIEEGKPHQALRHLSGLPATNEQVSLVRGLAELAAGELAAAAAALDIVTFQNPHNAEALWALGRTEIRRARGKSALAFLTRAVEANPHRLRFRLELGHLLIALGQYKKARPQFLAVLAQDPYNLTALSGRAFCSVELNHREVAADLFALKSSGHRNMAMLLSMRRWMRIGRWDQAAADLAHIDVRWLGGEPQGRLWRADILHKRGQLREARLGYQQLVKYRTTRPQACLALSVLSLSDGDLPEAIRYVRLAKKALKEGIYGAQVQSAIGRQLARCLEKAEAFDEAMDELKTVLARDASDFSANLMLGRIKAEVEEHREAVKYLARAIRIRKTKPARRLLARECGRLSDRPTQCM